MNEINGYWLNIPKGTNRNNLKHETNEWKKYQSYSLVTNAGGWKENINFPLKAIGFYDLKFTHIAWDFSSVSHDIQWIHKGSSCVLLKSSMSKVSCLNNTQWKKGNFKLLRDKGKKSFLTDDRKKRSYPSDQVKRQIKYQY